MTPAAVRVGFLWLSQVARNLADNCLWMFLVLRIASLGKVEQEAAWHQASAAFYLPFILLAPLHGAISNSWPRHWVLAGASGWCGLTALGLGLFLPPASDSWMYCLGLSLSMIGAAAYSPTRYALLPAAAQDTEIPLSRINGWMEMGGAGAVVAGLLLGVHLHGQEWLAWPAALVLVLGLNLLALVTALPVRFLADVRRPDSPLSALAGFFDDAHRVWANRESRGAMLGLAFFLALVVAGGGAVVAHTGALANPSRDAETITHLLLLMVGGTAAGSLLASLQGNPHRGLGLVTLSALGMTLVLMWSSVTTDLAWPTLLIGLFGGLANVPLRTAYQAAVPADARGNAMAISNFANYLLIIGLEGLLFALIHAGALTPLGQLVLLIVLAVAATAACSWFLLRPTVEQLLELVFWPLFRIRARGPGKRRMPERGPLVIIGNHACWLDPTWIGKITPRPLVPMMTSDFYDKPGLYLVMKHVFRVIRVQASRFRREAPELDEAVAELERDGCVLLFPEGWMRRKEETLLRPFGQGVWHILRRCPATPVVACWIEGGWGSYTSYHGGPPTKNKTLDFWRRVTIGVQEPIIVPADILADQRQTRDFLYRRVLEARRFLGLPVPEPDSGTKSENEDDKEDG